jgi:protein Tex
MNERHIRKVAEELKISPVQVASTAVLLNEGGTVPFIARYRKERTGQLDEVAITKIRDRMIQLVEFDARKESIVGSLKERNLLTDELSASIDKASTLAELEDLYLPFRPKRRTRATIARDRGLEPLAKLLFEQAKGTKPEAEAAAFVDAAKEVPDADAALAGARDIIAEWISEDADVRRRMRQLFEQKGEVKSSMVKGSEEKGAKFRDYFDWKEPVQNVPSHRMLAMFRGENEGFLTLHIKPSDEEALALLKTMTVRGTDPAARQVALAAEDCYERLLSSSMEVETRLMLRERAGEEAIRVFAENIRELLMASPLGRKPVLAMDPGYRTGCKVVCLDPQGKLLCNTVVYLTASDREREEASIIVTKLCAHFKIEAIAIGNGTASRETEAFVRSLKLPASTVIVLVNESGASIYSASEVAREEFPDQDVTVRGAVSIGRRLMDPLAELVKLEPKSIGVGQYQHDVDQGRLKQSLDDVVMGCVNNVGVELNTASVQLLSYVSGIGPALARKIVDYRNENGPFSSRAEIKKVPRLGAKAFEQAAGFLRIRDGENPLDGSAVHPESYGIVDTMAHDLKASVGDLIKSPALRESIRLDRYVTDTVGLPTLTDILSELARPGRDPRKEFEAFAFAQGVTELKDLTPGIKLPGIVTNVTKFGAFVDIGVHQDGLVHISELADHFVSDPAQVIKVHQRVMATVLEVDMERKRIALSLKAAPVIGPKDKNRSGGGDRGPRPASPRPQVRPAPGRSAMPNNPFVDAFGKL